jgi:hypothetical protein
MKVNLILVSILAISIVCHEQDHYHERERMEENEFKFLDEEYYEETIQKLLEKRESDCRKYRSAVNIYLRTLPKAVEMQCQLQCHNSDDDYAREFANGKYRAKRIPENQDLVYIPDGLPIREPNCGKYGDNCPYDFSDMSGLKFSMIRTSEDLLNLVTSKRYLTYCAKR